MSVPIPEGFPAATVDLQTALAGVATHAPKNLVSIAEKLFEVFWADGNTKITEEDEFRPILQSELVGDLISQVVSYELMKLPSLLNYL